MTTQNGRNLSDSFVEQRLNSLEGVSRGLAHEANNWLYTVMGQTELAEQHLRQVAVVVRYLETLLRRAQRAGGPLAEALPYGTIARLRQKLPRKTMRRRLDGLRRARENAEQLSVALHNLQMYATTRRATTMAMDLNSAVRAAVYLIRLGAHRTAPEPLPVTLNLAEGLPAALGSAGLVIGVIVDLAAGAHIEALQITTRSNGEALVCDVKISPATEANVSTAMIGARLCGGTIAIEERASTAIYSLRLPSAPPVQALRSGSA